MGYLVFRSGKCIYRRWTCDGDNDCNDNSEEDLSNGTVCGMYINYCFKRCVLFSLFFPYTAVNVYSTNIATTALQQ